ncbi:hypothetical protein MHK_010009 [Candidatus Magnetomorum sp. HK-1]|nr:hypothetical protein MHK_010009 [Candidatus Magnetomorum sp. HK-1]
MFKPPVNRVKSILLKYAFNIAPNLKPMEQGQYLYDIMTLELVKEKFEYEKNYLSYLKLKQEYDKLDFS